MKKNKYVVLVSLFLSCMLGMFSHFALAAIGNAGDLDPAVAQLTGPNNLQEQESNTRWHSGTYGQAEARANHETAGQIVTFGSQWFEGGFRGMRADGLNPDYRITPGDQVNLRIWGAVEVEAILPVDAQGNVFIPSVGPVQVQGVAHEALDAKIGAAVHSVYPKNVNVYTNLQGVQPVAVFVTGYVNKPGRYAGTPNDSAIYFLDQAGGIDNDLGSYRDIKVIRNNKMITQIDLYDFLLNGQLARPQFRDGDTLLVSERKSAILVTGDVQRDYHYELLPGHSNGRELAALARKKAGVSHALLRGDRADGPLTGYYTLEEFASLPLKNDDEVLLSVDKRYDTIIVELEGSYYGQSRYSLPRDAMLGDLLDAIAVPENMTDVSSISIKRKSVALRQKISLEESFMRLASTYLGAPSSTPQEATIRIQEAELINRFIAKASQVEPDGRLVVALDGKVANIHLQDGDVITIPEISDSLLISGEVKMPQSVVFAAGRSVEDYIDGAGGFSQHGDEDQILLVRQNGEVVDAEGVKLRAGDEILVLPAAPTHNLQLATSISQILYQLAVAARVVTDL